MKESPESRVQHFLPAAEQGDPHAQRTLGGIYLSSESPEKGVEWYRKAAEQEDALAMLELGDCYRYGRGVGKDVNEAITWYFDAVKHGNSQGYIRVANLYDEGREIPEDKTEALRLYRLAAEQKNPQAQFQIGNYYFNGTEVPQDKAEAVRWYHKSIDNGGWVLVQYQLGLCYFNGEGVHEDKEEAVKWFRQAAERNYWHAQHQLGYCYFYGQGIAQDKEEGVQWFLKAEARGHWKAMYELGKCYLYGDVLPQDRARAIEMLRKAAGAGRGGAEAEAAANLLRQLEEEAVAEREAVARGDYVPAVVELPVGRRESIRSVAFSPDGTKVFTAGTGWRGTVRIWNADTGEALQTLVPEEPVTPLNNFVLTRSSDWSPDGKKIVMPATDGTARIFDVGSGKELHKLIGHENEVRSAAFSPDGKNIVTASGDGTVRIWETESGKELKKVTVNEKKIIRDVFVRPPVASFFSPQVDKQPEAEEKIIERIETVNAAVFSPDGKTILTADSGNYTARIWDAESGEELQKFVCDSIVFGAVFSPDGKKAAISCSNGTIHIVVSESGKTLRVLRHSGQIPSASFSPDGKRIVTGSSYLDEVVRIWNVESGEELQKVDKHAGESIYAVAFSPDGKRIISAGGNGAVLIIDLERLAEQERQPPVVRPSVTDF